MGMSVSASTGFINREFLNDSANNRQNQNSAATNTPKTVVQNNAKYSLGTPLTTQQYIMLASSQITVNNSLKETLKYLRNHAEKNRKSPVFGELWDILNMENNNDEHPYQGELLNIEIDDSAINIFAA